MIICDNEPGYFDSLNWHAISYHLQFIYLFSRAIRYTTGVQEV